MEAKTRKHRVLVLIQISEECLQDLSGVVLFATSTSTAESAGATFWGVMEMSGNLKEMCYSVAAGSVFNGTVLGDGTYLTTKWNAAAGNIGGSGGGFMSGKDF